MEGSLVQSSGFVSVFPKNSGIIKGVVNDSLRVSCMLEEELAHKDIIVEVWTNITGRYHGHELLHNKTSDEKTEYFTELKLKHTGFYKITFRWRFKNKEFWTWHKGIDEKDFAEIQVDPEYINDAIVYNAFIRFFGQKDLEGKKTIQYGESGTFDDLKKKLGNLKKMGVNVLYLNPIHPIGQLYRNYNPHDQLPGYLQPGCPYSIRDYKSIDPELAIDKDNSQGKYESLSDPMKEFKEMVDAAHKKGIKVYMDLVFNHTSHDFILQRLHPEWFLYKENIKSLEEPYIYPEELEKGKPWGDPAHTMCPFDHGFWWEDAAQLNWEHMLLDSQTNKPPKNPTINEMYTYFKSIPKYWIKHFGIDGFRCDVAYRVPVKFWKECIHEAREFAKKEHPKNKSLTGDVVFIAESYVDNISELLEAGFTSIYGDYSNKLYNVETLKGYLDYIYNISGEYFPQNSKFFIFPECHDFVRNTKKLISQMSENEVFGERANQSRWVITATIPGIPMIFNGFEKIEWHPINLFSYSSIDWESDKDLADFISKVNKIRHEHKALQTGEYYYQHTKEGINSNAQIFSFVRTHNPHLDIKEVSSNSIKKEHLKKEDIEKILVCVNMDIKNKQGTTIYLDENSHIDFSKKYVLKDLLNGKSYERDGKELTIILEPGQSHIFLIEQ